MFHTTLKRSLLLLLMVIVVSSCTSGGEGGTGIQDNKDNVLAAGQIQNINGTSTVQVNGISFKTQASTISKDGATASSSDLETGMVVLITGKKESANLATASQLQIVDTIKGPLESPANSNNFTILGQSILYDKNTVFKNLSTSDFSDLESNSLLEIGGFIKESGLIVATYIEQKSSLSNYQAEGFVSNLDISKKSFKLGGLKVSYASAQLERFPNDTLANNQFVVVVGKADGLQNEEELTLIGDTVKHQVLAINDTPVDDIDNIEIEGYISINLSNNEFYLNNLKVQVNQSTRFERGTITDLQKGTKIEVEGYLASGIIIADEISFKEGIELRGNIKDISENGNITLDHINSSITIHADNNTQLSDLNNLDDLKTGNHIRIRGLNVRNGRLLASQLTLIQTQPSDRIVVQSHYRNFNAGNQEIDLSGFIINSQDITTSALESSTVDQFISSLKFDELLRCEGTVDLSNGIIRWTNIEQGD